MDYREKHVALRKTDLGLNAAVEILGWSCINCVILDKVFKFV